MGEREKTYIARVRQIIGNIKEPIETVGALAAIDTSGRGGFSLNTLNTINYIDGLDFEREDGELEGGVPDSKSYKEAEQKYCHLAYLIRQNVRSAVLSVPKMFRGRSPQVCHCRIYNNKRYEERVLFAFM